MELDIVAIGEPTIEFNQTGEGSGRLFLQGFGRDTSNSMIAAARLGARTAYFKACLLQRRRSSLTGLRSPDVPTSARCCSRRCRELSEAPFRGMERFVVESETKFAWRELT